MLKSVKKSLSALLCLCVLISCTAFSSGASFSDGTVPNLETVSKASSLAASLSKIITILDTFLTYPYFYTENQSIQSAAVEQILGVLLANKFETVDDVRENLATQREKNATSEVEDYYAELFNINIYKYTYTFENTGVAKTIEVGIFNEKPDDSLTGAERYVLYFHGGAFVDAPLPFHYWFCSRLAELMDVTVIMPMQLMAPEYTYTDSYALSIALYQDIIKQVDPAKLMLMGDSSGGNYVVSMGLQLRDNGIALPSNIIAFSPWLHMSTSDPAIVEFAESGVDPMIVYWAAVMKAATFVGIDVSSVTTKEEAAVLLQQVPEENTYLNPYNADYTGMPPISIFTGTHEILVVDSRSFAQRIESVYGESAVVRHMQGETWDGSPAVLHYYEYENMNHTFPLFPVPESVQVIKQIAEVVG